MKYMLSNVDSRQTKTDFLESTYDKKFSTKFSGRGLWTE